MSRHPCETLSFVEFLTTSEVPREDNCASSEIVKAIDLQHSVHNRRIRHHVAKDTPNHVFFRITNRNIGDPEVRQLVFWNWWITTSSFSSLSS